MRHFFIIVFCIITLTLPIQAQSQLKELPLRVAVSRFLPPYIFEGANKEMTGFDIIFMNQICKRIQRKCIFITMETNNVLPAIAADQADLGIGTLKITLEGYKLVNFSIPYMPNQSRFLGKKQLAATPFNLLAFNEKKIGVGEGGLFSTQLHLMKQFKPIIVKFKHNTDMIEALTNGEIDLAIVDNPTAIYWQNHSSDQLQALGIPFEFGYGLAVAVNQKFPELIPLINHAIVTYQETAQFKELYQMYFGMI